MSILHGFVHCGYADEFRWKMCYLEMWSFLYCMVFCISPMSMNWAGRHTASGHADCLCTDHLQRFSELEEWVWNPFENVWDVSKGFELFCKGFALDDVEFVHAFIIRSLTFGPKMLLGFLPNDVQGHHLSEGRKCHCWAVRWRLMGGKPISDIPIWGLMTYLGELISLFCGSRDLWT